MPLSPSFGQQATVKKVQGRKAIVEFPPDAKPYVGQTLDMGGGGGDGGASASGGGGSGGSRDKTIGFGGEFSSLSTDGNSVTTIALSGRYGWNYGSYEFGPVAEFSSLSSTGSSRTTFGGGGFFDYNLVPNIAGAEFVYGAGAEGTYSMVSTDNNGNSGSESVMGIFAGGFLKWFALGNSVAIRGDGGFSMDNHSSESRSYSASGFVIKGMLQVYF